MATCSICRGAGYITTITQKCLRCGGSGDENTRATTLTPLWAEIDRLHKEMNDRTSESAQRFARGEPERQRQSFARCTSCKGNGFTTDQPPFHDISKCRKCNGTGTTGLALPVIERLWYEIDRLKREMNKRVADAMRGRQERPVITDRDIWLYILGLDADADREAVKKAYKAKANECHPDHGGSATAFRAVKMAYDNLMEGLR